MSHEDAMATFDRADALNRDPLNHSNRPEHINA